MSSHPSFIVVFNDDVSQEQIEAYIREINTNGGDVTQEYKLLKGFAANLPESFVNSFQPGINKLVKYIEPNGKVTIQ